MVGFVEGVATWFIEPWWHPLITAVGGAVLFGVRNAILNVRDERRFFRTFGFHSEEGSDSWARAHAREWLRHFKCEMDKARGVLRRHDLSHPVARTISEAESGRKHSVKLREELEDATASVRSAVRLAVWAGFGRTNDDGNNPIIEAGLEEFMPLRLWKRHHASISRRRVPEENGG